jgi:hypothetical protein
MRPTDFCHLNDLRVPLPRVFPARSAVLRKRYPRGHPRSLGLRAFDRGTECFTTLANASADRRWTTRLPYCLSARRAVRGRCVGSERGRFLPTAPADRSCL